MKNILTITINPAVDKSSSVDYVVPERKLRCSTPRFQPGGGGLNVSRALGKLGADSVALYPSGGYSGKLLDGLLTEEGIQIIPVETEEMTRVNLIVLETSTGQQYRFGMPGQGMGEGEWKKCLELISTVTPRPEIVVASGSVPPGVPDDFFSRVVRIGKEIGAKTIVDTSKAALESVVKEGAYLIKINLREFQDLTNREINDNADLSSMCTEMISTGVADIFVVSLGTAGAFAAWKGHCRHFPSPTVPIKSKVGAGDSMVAGIVYKLALGKPIEDAIYMGIAAGAAAVMTEGSDLCRGEDALRLYHQIKEEAD